jgi:hypothetical protein
MVRLHLTIFFVLLAVLRANSQSDYRPGYVVLKNGDTLKGYVEYSLRSLHEKECVFRKDKASASTRYSPEELSGYGFHSGRQYAARIIPADGTDRSVFLQRLQSGRANLYLFDEKFLIEKDSLVQLPVPKKREVKKGDGIYLAEDKLYVGFLNMAFADCKVDLRSPAYEVRWISRAVEAYNQCAGGGPSAKTSSAWTKVNGQLFGGVKYIENQGGSSSGSLFPLIGASLELSSPAINDKLFLSFDLLYNKYFAQGSNVYSNSMYILRTDYTYRSTNLSIPVGVRYNLLQQEQTVYFKGGIALNYVFNPSGSLTIEREEAGVVTTSYSEVVSDSNQQTGLWLGTGFLKSFHPRINVFLEARAEFLSNLNLTFFAGLRF